MPDEEGEARAAAESEGLQLHLSNSNQTGYTGVSKIKTSPRLSRSVGILLHTAIAESRL